MFKFDQLRSIHLEITNRCQARCPMCSRNIRGGRDNPNLTLADWTLDDFKTIISPEVLHQIEHIYFCGNFGDPILNKHLPEMCRHIKDHNPNIRLRIHTNGGARNRSWWKWLAESLPEDHAVIFGIDGLEDTHHLYRIGTTYDNVISNAKTFMSHGGKAEWVFIKFRHNEHQVEEAERRAKELGFSQFTMKNSNRFVGGVDFDVHDLEGNVVYTLQPPSDNVVKFIDKKVIDKLDDWINSSTIVCKAQAEREIYIDAAKQLYPCCFLASAPYYYVEPNTLTSPVKERIVREHDQLLESLGGDLKITVGEQLTVKDILDSTAWQTTWQEYWNQKKLLTCSRICGVSNEKLFSKPSDQFVKRVSLDG
jgi:MoaA/NifB/PqqE/SkfB family radical SAM enzyme